MVVISIIEIFSIGFDALVHLVDFNHISGHDEVGLLLLLHLKGILPHLTVGITVGVISILLLFWEFEYRILRISKIGVGSAMRKW